MSEIFDAGKINRTDNCVTWTIDNFCSLPLSEGSEIRSKEFPYGNSQYTLVVWPRGRIGSVSYEWFGICLYNYSASESSDLNSVEFSIVSGDEDIKTCIVKHSESNTFWHSCLKFMKWSDFYKNIDYIAPSGSLTIVCRFFTKTGVFLKKLQSKERLSKESDRKIIHPMNNPPVKYQLGEYSLPETCSSEISSYKCPTPDVQISTYNASGVNNGPPSTINSFFSASYVEKPYQPTSESIETQNSEVSSNADDDNPEPTEMEISDFTTAHDAEKTSSDIESYSEIPDSSEDASSTNRCTGAANSSPKTPIWRILLLCCSAK